MEIIEIIAQGSYYLLLFTIILELETHWSGTKHMHSYQLSKHSPKHWFMHIQDEWNASIHTKLPSTDYNVS